MASKGNFITRLFGQNTEELKAELREELKGELKQEQPQAHYSTLLVNDYYDGETEEGEMGLAKRYIPMYESLRVRSWQAFYESDVAQMVLRKYLLWAIGKGLRLQSEPVKLILEKNGIPLDREEFTQEIETMWSLWAKSEDSDYTKNFSFNQLQVEAYKNAFVGGDVLVIQRVRKGKLSVQLVDGSHVVNPTDTKQFVEAKNRGRRIENGIELNEKNQHLAYYVWDSKKGNTVRVRARDSRGRKVSWLVYGDKYRIDHNRGIPLQAVILQRLKSMDRYQSAALTSAEERAKIPYFIQHGVESTGENPLVSQVQASLNMIQDATTDGSYTEGIEVAKKIAFTTNKTVHNLPIDAQIKSLDVDNELNVPDFLTAYIDQVCSSIPIPPEVAKSMYNSNFSASRAAIKDWEQILNVKRAWFSSQMIEPVFVYWLDLMVLSRTVDAPGYFDALIARNSMVINAYRNARFVGARVPHIDPVKEVQAARLKLGDQAAHVPLITVEQATEEVGEGNYEANVEQFTRELALAPPPQQESQSPEE